MKILNSEQIYQADLETMKKLPISSIDLMEYAANKCFEEIKKIVSLEKTMHIFCGLGNNGGDGLVIARLLMKSGYTVKTYIVNFSKKRSEDFKLNLERLNKLKVSVFEINSKKNFPTILDNEVIIDAIFGLGLSRTPTGFLKEVIATINGSKAYIISVDFPSGLFAERPVEDSEAVVKANMVFTFQNPKLAFFLPDNYTFIQDWKIINIGLDSDFINKLNTNYVTIDRVKAQKIYKKRIKFSHKGSFGHSLILGGSFGKIGAVVLASKASLKIGSGLVTSYIPKCGYTIVQSSVPEIMVEVDDENYLQYFNSKTNANAIGIGIGMGTHDKTKVGFVKFLRNNTKRLVLDADALNILSQHKELLDLIPAKSVLTPHPKEFMRLVGEWNNDYEKLDLLINFSKRYKFIVVLKGAFTSVAYKGEIYFNTTGNPGLATAGSGDVLTGIITGLLAQGYSSLNACLLGVYLHGLSADLAIEKNETQETFIASDIIKFMGSAYKSL